MARPAGNGTNCKIELSQRCPGALTSATRCKVCTIEVGTSLPECTPQRMGALCAATTRAPRSSRKEARRRGNATSGRRQGGGPTCGISCQWTRQQERERRAANASTRRAHRAVSWQPPFVKQVGGYAYDLASGTCPNAPRSSSKPLRGKVLDERGFLKSSLWLDAPNYADEIDTVCYAMLCYAMRCYAMLALLCYAMLCYAPGRSRKSPC